MVSFYICPTSFYEVLEEERARESCVVRKACGGRDVRRGSQSLASALRVESSAQLREGEHDICGGRRSLLTFFVRPRIETGIQKAELKTPYWR